MQKDETLEAAFERLTMAELGLRLPITAGQFYGVWQHCYDDNFSGTDFVCIYHTIWMQISCFNNIKLRSCCHKLNFISGTELSVYNSYIYNNTLIWVII